MSYQVINPFIQFVDPINGNPLSAGSVYFGRKDSDPKNQPANRINVYAVQDNGSEVLLSQPITLNGAGQPQYSGSVKQIKIELYAGENSYAIQVFNKNGSQKGYSPRVSSMVDVASLASATSSVIIAGKQAYKISASVDYLTPEQFFIAGEVDDTGMLMRMAAAITDGSRCEFQEREYIISYAGTGLAPYAQAPYGAVIIDISGHKNVTLNGNNATIKCVNHNIATNGGFLFLRGSANQSPRVRGFSFDMSFIGVNTSSLYYPWCGAIVFFDEATGTHTQDELCSDVVVEDCAFKLYHPYGAFALSGTAYDGDPNNGYKLFGVFVSGDNDATTRATQNNKVRLSDCLFKSGHNGYGLWVWCYNDVFIENPTAESWVLKYSTAGGVYAGSSVPFVRYHQFYCKGVQISNIQFTAKPSSERVGAFAGEARAIGLNTNLNAAGLDGGDMIISGGSITAGNGDLANSATDVLIFCNAYGRLSLDGGMLIDGMPASSNDNGGGTVLQYSPESTSGTGYGEVHIGDISLGKNLSYLNSIEFFNGASSAANRRCKLLTISDVCSMSQFQYFLDTDGGSAAVAKGVDELRIGDVLIDGTNNTVFGPASTNSRAFRFAGESTDTISGNNVKVKGKYYEFITTNLQNGALMNFDAYSSKNTTTRVLGLRVPILNLVVTGSPEATQVANIGSTARRTDGGAGTTFYVKESGTSDTGWVAK